jgi:SAM-dependent methyltransferase
MENHEYQLMYEFENGYWWYQALHELVLHHVQRFDRARTERKRRLRVFDAGCGTGRLMELLNPIAEVEGIDYSEEAIRLCKRRGLARAEQGDLNTWSPADSAYDVVISNDVICTSGVRDDKEAMRKFHHALRPGGLLILNLPSFELLRRRHDEAVCTVRRYRRDAALRTLREIGFSPVCATYRLPALFCFLLLQKHLVERFKRSRADSDLKPIPAWLNAVMYGFNRAENALLKAGLSLPFGSSLFLVCTCGKRPAT